jgi:methionyl-tRNA formyltransferase
VPSLRALAGSPHEVVGVISQPDRPRGRGRRLEPTPVKRAAEELGLPVTQPERVGSEAALEWMRPLEPDLGCVIAFGQFIPRSVRQLPEHGLINAHASLLPRHRGAAPIQHAILCGDTKTGVTIIRVVREMDAGDACLERETGIGPQETAGELADRLAGIAAGALVEAVERIAAGRAVFRPQGEQGVTLAPKVDPEFGRIDWSEPTARVLRRIRAATPAPGAHTELHLGRGGEARRLRILRASAAPELEAPDRPGRLRSDGKRLWISALDGWVEVNRLQEVGRKALDVDAYLRGARLPQPEEVEAR